MSGFLWRISALFTLLATCGATPPARASESLEYEVKAAMIYNFTRFVEWPPAAFPTAQAPLVVAVLGDDPLQPHLEAAMAGKTYSGHPIQVRRVHTIEELAASHLAYIPRSERKRIPDLLRTIGNSPLLTVSDCDGFAASGGVIGFMTINDRVRFQINKTAAAQAGLSVSSKLLALSWNSREQKP
ncbi:MAG: YfiR family protein [Bryobacterales bacterium]|nr:YfiR family protein [Bryobacterales bacterium]